MDRQKHYNLNNLTRETYYQLPKVFFTNHSKYEKLSLTAAVAFSFLKDRLNYSIKNNWVDKNGDIYFIFTNSELGETLKVKSSATVVKIKKELEKFELLEQQRMGVNQPNRLYLLQPEVTATDIYEINNAQKEPQSLQPHGSLKNELPENSPQPLQPHGSLKKELPENSPQSLEPHGSLKIKHNQDKEYLDTSKIHEDTHLDFSTSKYSPEQIALQNADLKDHLTEIMDAKVNTDFISHAALDVIRTWCNTPAEVERVIQIILNAKNATVKEMSDKGFSLQSVLLSLENEVLQQEVTTWLRSFFNKVRASEHNPKKRIKNAENYLYRTMYNGFTKFAHTQLQAHADVSEKRIK